MSLPEKLHDALLEPGAGVGEQREAFSARSLDVEGYLQMLVRFAASSLGRRALAEIVPLDDSEARRAATRLAELTDLDGMGERPSFAGVSDLQPALLRAREQVRPLEEDEFIRLFGFLGAVERLEDWLERRRVEAPELAALGAELPDLSSLSKQLGTVLDSRGRIRRDASPLLTRLHDEERRHERSIERRLKALIEKPDVRVVLSDASLHRRSGRTVLAVKAKSAGRVRGLVHDRSQSEQTIFVEPREVIELGNKLSECRAALHRETERLLAELTRAVLGQMAELALAARALAKLELAQIGLSYALECAARIPELVPEVPETGARAGASGLVLRGARHPLLIAEVNAGRLDEVVPVDLRLGDDFDMLVITGPNTGGKTLALKTAGLAVFATRIGMPVPCREGSRIPLYTGVVADIGDEQEIEQSLSTFSSHIVRIRDGLARANRRTLCLLDELGGGTDPDEGAALGAAILNHLLERGVPTLASTHLGKLKEFAYRNARVENACVEFDPVTLAPRYRLIVGTPGESGALAIALRTGLPAAIVEDAEDRLERREGEIAELMGQVQRARSEAERVRSEAESRLEDVTRTKRELAEQEAVLERRVDQLEAEAQRGLEERVRDARRSLERAQALLDQLPAEARIVFEEALGHVARDLEAAGLTERRTEFLKTLGKGKLVYLPRYKQRCLIQKVNQARREVTVKLGAMKLKVAFDEVTWYEGL